MLSSRKPLIGKGIRRRVQDDGQSHQQRRIIAPRAPVRLLRLVLSKETPSCACRNKKEDAFAGEVPEPKRSRKQSGSLDSAQNAYSLPTVKNPDGDQIQDVQDRSGAGQRSPEWVAGLGVNKKTAGSGDPAASGPASEI